MCFRTVEDSPGEGGSSLPEEQSSLLDIPFLGDRRDFDLPVIEGACVVLA